MHSVTVRSWLETGQAVRKYNKSAMFVQQGALSGLKAWSVDNFSLSAVTSDMVGHFVMDRSYLIQCTYCADGMVDRHVIYFWQGWNCSRVESLVWQYDISALMANQVRVWRLAASVDLSRVPGMVGVTDLNVDWEALHWLVVRESRAAPSLARSKFLPAVTGY